MVVSVSGSREPAEDRDRGGAVVGAGSAAFAMFESRKPPAKIPAALNKRKSTVTGRYNGTVIRPRRYSHGGTSGTQPYEEKRSDTNTTVALPLDIVGEGQGGVEDAPASVSGGNSGIAEARREETQTTMTGRSRVGVVVFVTAAVIGVAVFGMLAWRSVTVLQVDASGAINNFEDVKGRVPSTPPLVQRDPSGNFRRQAPEPVTGRAARQLHALAYYVEGQRLVRADVPLWFLKVKGPAVRYAMRDTGFDLDALNLTASDLERAGARVILDETRSSGDRLLVWTE